MPLVTATPFGAIPEEYGLILNGTDQFAFHDSNIPGTILAASIWIVPSVTLSESSGRRTLFQTQRGSTSSNEEVVFGSSTSLLVNEAIAIHNNISSTQYRTGKITYTFSSGSDHHIVINWNSGQSRYDIYLNGSVQTVSSGTSAGHAPQFTVTSSLVVGAFRDPGSPQNSFSYLPATVSNFILYDTALSGGEITTLYNGGKNAAIVTNGNELAIYKFDDKTGNTANDTSGNGNHLSLANNPNWL